LTPEERELLQGMGNCYSVCGEDFENTVNMVASGRDRTDADVMETLSRMGREYADDAEYKSLRGRLPADFPF
jgi:RecB family endonuclease NucS